MVSDLEKLGGRLLVIFDGRCGMCNWVVRWLLHRDRLDRLRFAPYESEEIANLLERHGFEAGRPSLNPDTVLVVSDPEGPAERVLIRSEAVLTVLRELQRPWPTVAAVLGLVPRPVLDIVYKLNARWRYRIWGRLESCPVPTAEGRERFL